MTRGDGCSGIYQSRSRVGRTIGKDQGKKVSGDEGQKGGGEGDSRDTKERAAGAGEGEREMGGKRKGKRVCV